MRGYLVTLVVIIMIGGVASKLTYDYSCRANDLGKIRLVDDLKVPDKSEINTQAKKGRLEVCLFDDKNQTYRFGTFCDDNFGAMDAYSICKSLPYGEFGDGKEYGRDSNKLWNIGVEDQPTYVDEVACLGEETKWYDCGYEVDGDKTITIDGKKKGKPKTNCNHKEDVFVKCTDTLYCYTCDSTSYDMCTALELVAVKCPKGKNACHRKVSETLAGVISIKQGCLDEDEPDCTNWNKICSANTEMKTCYCNHCTTSYCNSLFQQMTLDIALYATSYGELVEWILGKFAYLMRVVMFDPTALESLL